ARATGRHGGRRRWRRSKTAVSRRCSTGCAWPAPWRSSAAGQTRQSSSRATSSTRTRSSPSSSPEDRYLSCSVAILFALSSTYHGSPLGAIVIPNGSLPLTPLPSVITPVESILATLPPRDSVNHTEPSGPAAMPSGPVVASWNSVTWLFIDGSRNPTTWENRFVNQTFPSVAMAIPRGPFGSPSPIGVNTMVPVPGSSLPMLFVKASVDQTIPLAPTATSDGLAPSGSGSSVNWSRTVSYCQML